MKKLICKFLGHIWTVVSFSRMDCGTGGYIEHNSCSRCLKDKTVIGWKKDSL